MKIVDERNYITTQLSEKGFEIFDFYDHKEVLTLENFCALPLQRRSDVLLLDTQTLLNHPELQENFKTMMNTFLGVIFFHEQTNQKALSWVQDQAAFLTKIVGEYALPMPQLPWTMLSNQLNFFWTLLEDQRVLQKHITQFSQELDQVLITAESEVAKAKKVHEVLIPKRSDDIKGIRFYNKYAAGDGGGGEFYDLHQSAGKVFQILIASQSYLISSALMGVLNSHKRKEFNPEAFLKDAREEIQTINGAKKKKSEVDLVVMELDTTLLSLKIHGGGKADFHSQIKGKITIDTNGGLYQIERGEKIVVFSPGFIFNWNEGRKLKDIHSFIKDHQHLAAQDLMMELFFQLRQEKHTEFLKKDATVVMMEVNRHGMHQV